MLPRPIARDRSSGTIAPGATYPVGVDGSSPRAATRRDLLLNAAGGTAPMVVGLLLMFLLVPGLGAARFGVWSLVAVGIGLVGSLDLGIGAAAFRFFGVNEAHRQEHSDGLLTTLLVLLVPASLVSGFLLRLAATPLAAHLHAPAAVRAETAGLLRWLGFVMLIPIAVSVAGSRLQAAQRFLGFALCVGLGQLVYLAGACWVIASGAGLTALLAALACGLLVTLGGQLLALLVGHTWHPLAAGLLGRREAAEFATFAWAMQRAGLWAMVNLELDGLVVAVFLPVQVVGAYAVGASVASGLRSAVLTLLPPLLPPLAAVGLDAERSIDVARCVHRDWLRVAAAPALLGIPAVTALAWALGHQQGGAAALVALMLSLGNAVNLGTGVISFWARASGRPVLEVRYGRLSGVVNVGLTLVLVPTVGLVGVCAATAVGQVVGSTWFVGQVERASGSRVRVWILDGAWRLPAILGVIVSGMGAGLALAGLPGWQVVALVGIAAALAWATSLRYGWRTASSDSLIAAANMS
jgi:O-antigen/teichoic acid export membrane protein